MTGANITEIFQSFQGEGSLAGKPFLFVRFGGCNINCAYCDTRWSAGLKKNCRVRTDRETKKVENPVTVERFARLLEFYKFSFISFTGGEPLIYSGFIEDCLPLLKDKHILIETNGTLAGKISKKLIENIDYWSVDIKLFSTSKLSIEKEHRSFLSKVSSGKNILIKCVFSPESTGSELRMAYEMSLEIWGKNPNTNLTFQPLTVKNRIKPGKNLEIIRTLSVESGMDIRLIPQIHRVLHIK